MTSTPTLPQSPPPVTPWQPAPVCARCHVPLSDVDVIFADGRHCCHCYNQRAVTFDASDEECLRG